VASTETDQLIGTLFLKRDRDELEVGYLFLPEYWGRGLAFEALETLLRWVSETCTDKEITAVTQTANERSMRLHDRRRAACKTAGSAYVGSNPTPATRWS
jgi:RimJ/RimL family protein N-acetyltransferase